MRKIIPLLQGVPITGSGGALGWSSVTLIRGEKENVLVDTGFQGNRHLLLKALADNQIHPDEIDWIVLTHMHFDHCLNIDLFKKAGLVLSRAEYDYVKNREFLENGDVFIPDILDKIENRDLHLFNQEFLLTQNIRCLLTPGHTPGSAAVIVDLPGQEKTAICGDLFKYAWEVHLLPDVPQGTFGSAAELKASQQKILALDVKRFIFGHDRPFKLHDNNIIFDHPGNCEISLFMDTTEPKVTSYKFKLAK